VRRQRLPAPGDCLSLGPRPRRDALDANLISHVPVWLPTLSASIVDCEPYPPDPLPLAVKFPKTVFITEPLDKLRREGSRSRARVLGSTIRSCLSPCPAHYPDASHSLGKADLMLEPLPLVRSPFGCIRSAFVSHRPQQGHRVFH
jgi:hypothetical protein